MDPLETLLRPLSTVLNRNIRETTPARELCRKLDGKTIAVRVRNTSLAMYFHVRDEVIELCADSERDPDVVLTGSMLTLAKTASPRGDAGALRDGAIDLTGDAFTAQTFQDLLRLAKPDFEEELSRAIGDVAAHRAGEFARGLGQWARNARATMGANIREYLQEESRELPSRYEVDRLTSKIDTLRDDVARLEARLERLARN